MNVRKLTQLAMLTGVALIIFVIELQIPNPFPIPGIKLGLANIITVYNTRIGVCHLSVSDGRGYDDCFLPDFSRRCIQCS